MPSANITVFLANVLNRDLSIRNYHPIKSVSDFIHFLTNKKKKKIPRVDPVCFVVYLF